MPFKIKCPECCKNPEHLAKGYSYFYLIFGVYHVISFWYDVAGFWQTWRYILIFIGFVVPPVVLGFILLIAVHKRELKKTWIWWLLEILLLALFVTLYLVGIHALSWKTVLVNLILQVAIRLLGLKIIYDYMLFISETLESGNGINRIDVSKEGIEMSSNTNGTNGTTVASPPRPPPPSAPTTSTNPFENVPLDDAWSGQEKL
ncbi:hypothetical protein Ocin01_08386 [Orchesella cincta]|uniref:Uncharacterized protein n=1 Tax=Orchesella cincta TaxID=48709 RepID=A0A1D2MZ82_ORCCI|nr:hypothetical protein Ocin01_08386 [Orchesella cincta]